MIPASQTSTVSNNMALVRLSDLPWVTEFTVAEPGLDFKSRVLAKSHMVHNVNLCRCRLRLAKIEGTFLHASGIKIDFHAFLDGPWDKINWGSTTDPTSGVSQAHRHEVALHLLRYSTGRTYLTTEVPLLIKLTSTRMVRDIIMGFMFQKTCSGESAPISLDNPSSQNSGSCTGLKVLQKGAYKAYLRSQLAQGRRMPWGELEWDKWEMIQRRRRSRNGPLCQVLYQTLDMHCLN